MNPERLEEAAIRAAIERQTVEYLRTHPMPTLRELNEHLAQGWRPEYISLVVAAMLTRHAVLMDPHSHKLRLWDGEP